jgi:hypothetical protein
MSSGNQLLDVRFVERRDDVDVNRGARLAGKGAGNRAAYSVHDPQRLEVPRDEQRGFDRIDGGGHRAITLAASGYARAASSAPSTMTATRRNCSRGDAPGWQCRTPAHVIAYAARVNPETIAAFSARDIRRHASFLLTLDFGRRIEREAAGSRGYCSAR